MASEADIIEEVLRRQQAMESERSTWETHWQEIAERVLVRQSGSFNSTPIPGDKRTDKQYDPTAALALDRFSAAMESMLTPRNGKWHRLRATDPRLNKAARVRRFFDEVTDLLFRHRYSPRANFASQKHEEYISLGAFGTGALFTDRRMPGPNDPRGGLRYRAIHLAEIYFLENFQGVPDTAHRKFKLTARQALQQFDPARLPEKVHTRANEKPDEQLEFLHCVLPREDLDPGKADYRGMPFASYYVLRDDKAVVGQGGFQTFPYSISRYVTAPGETYGRSPAMTVLPAIKVLNEQKKTSLKMGHRLTDPIILGHDDGVLDTFSLKPGAMVPGGVNAQGQKLVHTLDMPNGQLNNLDKLMEMERSVINDAFLVTLFQILVDTPQMTATEVLERAREKGALLAPTMGRQQSEALGPMIERELDILVDMGAMPSMPPELLEAAGEFSVEYDSPLSRSMRAEEASGFMRTLEFATAYANVSQDPSVFDHFDFDTALPEIADIQAVPARWMADPDKVAGKRDGRAQQAQVQTMVDAAPSAAAMMKVMQGNR